MHGEKLAKTLQLAIEYDPQPPFDSGAPEKADAGTLRLALRILLGDNPAAAAHTVGHAIGQRARRVGRATRTR